MKIPFKDFTELIEKFVETHAAKAMKKSVVKSVGPAKGEIYNLDLFLNIIYDENVSDKLKEIALNSFARLLDKEPFLKEKYIVLAGGNINIKTKVTRNMQILKKLDYTAFLSNLVKTSKEEKKFESFMQRNNILPVILQSCQDFHAKVKELLHASPELKKQLMTQYLFGESGLSFEKHARLYLDFLQDCFTSSDRLKMELVDLELIWKLYFLDSFNEDHSNILWEVLMMEKKDQYLSGKNYGFFKGRIPLSEFFEKFLCNGAKFIPSKASIVGIQCFMKYFVIVNENKLKPRRPDTLTGINMLWMIPFALENQTIRSQAIIMLVELYKKNIMEEISGKKDLVEKFLLKVLMKVGEDSKSVKVAMEILNQYTQG